MITNIQDWSLQFPTNAIWPFKTQPQIENENVTWSRPQYNLPTTRINKRRALSLQKAESDGRFSILHNHTRTHVPYDSCTSLTWVLYFITVFLDWRLGLEQALQLKSWNLRAIQNETRMRASILNSAIYGTPLPKPWKKEHGTGCISNEALTWSTWALRWLLVMRGGGVLANLCRQWTPKGLEELFKLISLSHKTKRVKVPWPTLLDARHLSAPRWPILASATREVFRWTRWNP